MTNIYTIEEVTHAHWRDTVVLRGETPEAYASRREEDRIMETYARSLAIEGVV